MSDNLKIFNTARIDSLKIRIRRSKVKILDDTLISEYVKYYPDIKVIDEQVNNATPFVHIDNGITYRIYIKAFINSRKQAEEYIVFQVSAKMLKEQYFDGITLNNYKRIVDDINALQVVYISYEAMLDGLVSDIDLCINQLVDLESYKAALSLIRKFPKDSVKPLLHFISRSKDGQINNLGVDFNKREKATNTKPYCKIYHKGFELKSKSKEFFKAFLSPLKLREKFLKNLVRYEFTIKAHKHKEYLCKKGFKADFKTLGELLGANANDLTNIAKTGLKMYLEENSQSRISGGDSPTDTMILYFMENLINLGFDTEKMLGFAHLIECPVARSRTKSKAKKLLDSFTSIDKNIEAKLRQNNRANSMLKNLGFEAF